MKIQFNFFFFFWTFILLFLIILLFIFSFIYVLFFLFLFQFTIDDLPPPPDTSEYVSCIPGSYGCLSDDLPPPPSPVSSSYSELRRATYPTDFPSESYPNDIYGPSSQSSSTYESIYEPINPRPPSQLSCNYSIYSGYGPPPNQGKISPVKQVSS